jgi:hypothetical protein
MGTVLAYSLQQVVYSQKPSRAAACAGGGCLCAESIEGAPTSGGLDNGGERWRGWEKDARDKAVSCLTFDVAWEPLLSRGVLRPKRTRGMCTKQVVFVIGGVGRSGSRAYVGLARVFR